MKAIVHTAFGPPEVLKLREVPKPVPKDDEVLIKIYASAVTAVDTGYRRSFGRTGIGSHENKILGYYLAGEIEPLARM